ncbi:beta tubulin [Methylobacterium sp. Leaf102]|uniref:DUF2163 domain-containing protein n=1 Tax=Methylobacterium sp. Leaf102 TaxID=1736253 RepID=UPI0006FCB975|nr:DUF2163 domain-containing protein [Methylobacterium sp. Leaf102]KQP34307.1 beta tubulin [Methylobacterium sp. Leaf102]
MKVLSPTLAASLASGITTLCRCWIVTRTDGLRLGFTDHDEPVTIEGVVCSAESGATGSAIEQTAGLSPDGYDIMGALTDGRLSDIELARGLFDGAAVEAWRVDWSSPVDRVLVMSGTIGEVSRGSSAFTAEVRSLADRLNQPRGRIYQRSCDATFGDARCGIDATAATMRGVGVVTLTRTTRSFVASGLAGFRSGRFTAGRFVWTTGANVGTVVEVRTHLRANGGAHLELWEPMAAPITPGDAFDITAGCDKALDTCRDKFANTIRFRGFPDLPGNDYAVRYVTPGAENDGGRLG